jgi:hypothetical protein
VPPSSAKRLQTTTRTARAISVYRKRHRRPPRSQGLRHPRELGPFDCLPTENVHVASHLVKGVNLDYMFFSILMNLIPHNCSEKWWGGDLNQTLPRDPNVPFAFSGCCCSRAMSHVLFLFSADGISPRALFANR